MAAQNQGCALPNRRLNELGFTIESLNNMSYYNNIYRNVISDLSGIYVKPCQKIDINFVSLSIISFNIRSMNKNFINFKTEILECQTKYDIIGLYETRLSDSVEKLYA